MSFVESTLDKISVYNGSQFLTKVTTLNVRPNFPANASPNEFCSEISSSL
jgi:hypothetical protein